MKISVTFRHMDHSAEIENYANEKLEKIIDFLKSEPTPIYIDLVLEPSKVHAHNLIELRVRSPHYRLITHHEGPDFYMELDHVIDIMHEQLLKVKQRHIDERKTEGRHDEFKKQR